MARPGLIVDRDGTLVYERGYVVSADQLCPLPGVEFALRKVRSRSIPVAMITNQSAVGRGLVSELALARMHDRLRRLLSLDAVYVCPHRPDDQCTCRKPSPELVQRALVDLSLDPRRTLVVGDNLADCMAGRAAGVDAVLVRSGHGCEQASLARSHDFRVFADLPEAVEIFLAGYQRR